MARSEEDAMKLPADTLQQLDASIAAVEARPSLADREAVLQMLRAARRQAERAQQTPLGTTDATQGNEELALSLVLSAVSGAAAPDQPSSPVEIVGTKQYEDLDPGWIGSFYNYLFSKKVPFPTHNESARPGEQGSGIVPVADTITLALAGDWGTGNASSTAIARRIAALAPQPSYTVHLGDVYYSGTPDEELQRFVTPWPSGVDGAFAINSNHEMYSGGKGYFSRALESPKFRLQQGLSYFALENAHWIIFGLDSAYPSQAFLYDKGELDAVQLRFLARHGARARAAGKRVMVLTHHQPIEMDGSVVEPLCDKVTRAVGVRELTWYWGHIHGAAVLQPKIVNGVTIHGRCVGHGGVPYALFNHTSAMEWTEVAPAGDPEEPLRGLNGFAVVRLDGASIDESLLGEDGSVRHHIRPLAAAA
jgi:calcineurin-like phosphoesterase family protein